MLKFSLASILAFVLACATNQTTTGQPLINGDTCRVHLDRTSCDAEAGCVFYELGIACPANGSYCPSGVCQASTGGGGSGSGSGHAGCACGSTTAGQEVCYEQVGGPAQQGGTSPQIECIAPTPGSGDACARIVGQGNCSASTTVTGLCICDNGIR